MSELTFGRTDDQLNDDPSCWVSPEGKVTFVLGGQSHCTVAKNKLGDETSGIELERQGYLHISFSSVMLGYRPGSGDVPPTQAQLDAVFDIAQAARRADPQSYVAERFTNFLTRHQKETL